MSPAHRPPVEHDGKLLPGRSRLPPALARAAAACLLLAGTACTALIDQELSGKASAAGAAGAAGDSSEGGGGTGGEGQMTIPTCLEGCSLPHATATCAMGACELVDCDPQFADCNGERLDGCEVELLNDSQHCGKCEGVCQGGSSCDKGKCK